MVIIALYMQVYMYYKTQVSVNDLQVNITSRLASCAVVVGNETCISLCSINPPTPLPAETHTYTYRLTFKFHNLYV